MIVCAAFRRHHRTMKSAVTMACVPFTAPALAQDQDYIEHRLKAGESPFTLASDYLSSPNSYSAILQVNGVSNARKIPVGMIIRLPRHLLAYRSAGLRVEAFSGEVTIDGIARNSRL